MLYLALKKGNGRTSVKELVLHIRVPPPFLAKVLQDLSHKGMLTSCKGPRGGFALARPANHITLLSVVEAIDGAPFASGCVLGFAECTIATPCALHSEWSIIRDRTTAALRNKNLAEMARQMRKPEYADA